MYIHTTDEYSCDTHDEFVDLMIGWFTEEYNDSGTTPNIYVNWKGVTYLVSLSNIELDSYGDINEHECVVTYIEVEISTVDIDECEMFADLYGSHVEVNDRFETVVIWCKEVAIRNNGRFTPMLISKKQFDDSNHTLTHNYDLLR